MQKLILLYAKRHQNAFDFNVIYQKSTSKTPTYKTLKAAIKDGWHVLSAPSFNSGSGEYEIWLEKIRK